MMAIAVKCFRMRGYSRPRFIGIMGAPDNWREVTKVPYVTARWKGRIVVS